MGQVIVSVGGRRYPLSCADGEEGYLATLGAMLAAKADELTAAIGSMSEPRLLLMAGLQIADELASARSGATGDAAARGAGGTTTAGGAAAADDADAAAAAADDADAAAAADDAYAAVLTRIEALAATLAG